MVNRAVGAVVILSITLLEFSHESAERGFRAFEQERPMVWHQAGGVDGDPVSLSIAGEILEVGLVIGIVRKTLLPVIVTDGHLVQNAAHKTWVFEP